MWTRWRRGRQRWTRRISWAGRRCTTRRSTGRSRRAGEVLAGTSNRFRECEKNHVPYCCLLQGLLPPPLTLTALNSPQTVVGVQRHAEREGHRRLHPSPHGCKVLDTVEEVTRYGIKLAAKARQYYSSVDSGSRVTPQRASSLPLFGNCCALRVLPLPCGRYSGPRSMAQRLNSELCSTVFRVIVLCVLCVLSVI